jgi:hypothetical protein
VDGSGNAFISGYTYGSLGWSNAGNSDAYIAKYGPAGNLLWIQQLGTSDYDWSSSVAVDGSGNVFISGRTYGSLGGTNAGELDAFLVKFAVLESSMPVADAGEDKTVYAWIDGIAEVELDGSGSYDADGDELSYLWTWEIGEQVHNANMINPVIELGVGENERTLVVNDGLEDSEPNEVIVTVVGPVEVDVRVMPRVLNGKGRGRYVLAVMQLPDGIGRDDIDESYGFVLEPGGIDATFWQVLESEGESIIFAMFDRARLIDATEGASTGKGGVSGVEVNVAGKLVFGEYIYGADVIRIIKPGKRPTSGGRHIRRGRGGSSDREG